MEPETLTAFFKVGQIKSLCAAHMLEHRGEDADIYEDEYVKVICKDGHYVMTGKPFREPFIYTTTKLTGIG